MKVEKGVSVIICCYNSATRIVDTLKHLSNQIVPETIQWEIILVDNASSDRTVEVARETLSNTDSNTPLIIVHQPIPGLSFARQKGIESATKEFLLFCDDDNWLDCNYVKTVYEIMNSDDKIGALGGWGIPKFEVSPPDYITPYSGTYATGPQGTGTEEVKSHHVYGAGCTYRKSALLNLFNNGFTYYLTGRKGDVLLAGDDHELCYALFLSGHTIWYSEKLKFYHFIPANRISYDYIKNNILGFARSNFILTVYKIFIAQAARKRNKIKNSWSWILALKLIFLVKGKSKNLMSFKKSDRMNRLIIQSDILSIKLFLKKRKDFYKIMKDISNSAWVSGRYKTNDCT